MTDLLGKEVSVGDTVVFPMPQYKNLLVGIVHNITPKGISCAWDTVKWLNDTDEVVLVPKHHQSSRDFISRQRHQFAKL